MKNNKFTESKAENSPSGGVLVGKRKGQTIIHNKGTLSGYLVGKTHDEGGIKAINKSTGQPLEMQGGEVVITAPAVADQTKREFNGEMLTNREILSKINEMGGGVSFAKGGDIPEKMKYSGASYNYGGKTMTDHEIMMLINNGGHLAKGMTLKQIADKHDVTLSKLNHQVKLGLKAESEHTSSKREQMQIVKDHLFENPEYYTLLKKAGLKKGGEVKTWKQKYNKKYGYPVNESHDLEEIAKDTGISLKGLQQIYNKGIGAYKTNPESVRPNVKSKEQWAMARVYSAVMGGKSSKVDANELKMKRGGQVKEDLIKDSKKGDHTSRDLNNYNDLMDVGVDGEVGGETGLELTDGVGSADASGGVGAFAKGGSLDFLDDVDKIFAGGGLVDARIDNWSEIPERFLEISYPQKVKLTGLDSNLNNFLKPYLREKQRPALSGVNIDEYGLTATDTNILIHLPQDGKLDLPTKDGVYFPKKYPDEVKFVLASDIKYPNYVNIIPKKEDIKYVYQIDLKSLYTYLKVTSEIFNNKYQIINVEINKEQMAFFVRIMLDFVTSLIKLNIKDYVFVSFQSVKKALVFSFEKEFELNKIFGLIMPNIYAPLDYLGAMDKEKELYTNFYYSFNYDKIFNSDGTQVVLLDKPKKTRAKRTPKTTPVEPETKTPFDLLDKKIWIGDNPELSRRIQEFGFENGFENIDGKKVYMPQYSEIYFTTKGGQKYMYILDNGRKFFEEQSEIEIFVSDLFPETKELDLSNTKIWIGDNEELSKRVQERLFELGWEWNAGGQFFQQKATSLYLKGNKKLLYSTGNKKEFDKEKWREIFESDLFPETKKIVSTQEMIIQPSQSADIKPNFELERKFLTSRINELSLELNVKKIILTKEEATFYQREINKFISLLRNLNEKELSTKLISDRFDSIYSVKFGDFKKEYPSADLKSINGLPTQLTEKEYLDVRTPEFRAFFGDWQDAYLTGNYESVSKVINEKTKEPMPVYHGTNVLFTNWKTYDTNNAHYFAVRRDFSDFFATTWEERVDKSALDSKTIKNLNPNKGTFMFRCFIDVKNPIDFSKFGVDKYPVSDFLTYLKINYNISDYDFWTNIDLKSGVDKQTMVYAWQIIRLWQSFTQYVKLFTTHDGYIFYEYLPDSEKRGMEDASLCYCAFDSNQIKFNDAYEFNALSNDSRFDFGGKL